MTLLPLHSVIVRAQLLRGGHVFRGAANNNALIISSCHRRLQTENYSTSPIVRILRSNFTKCLFHTRGGPLLMTTLRNKGDGVFEEQTCAKCSHVYANGKVFSTDNGIEFFKIVSCPQCGALQKIGKAGFPNYFEILGQQKSYCVNLEAMSMRSRQLQKKFHPDLYSQKESDQQDLSQEYSSLINKALSTLSDPISRGWYLLSLSDLSPVDDPDNDIEKAITNDPEFLEKMMELNERLEEISSEGDWNDFRNQNVATMLEIHEKLQQAFDNKQLSEAYRMLGRLQYFDTLQRKLKEVQSRIGIVE